MPPGLKRQSKWWMYVAIALALMGAYITIVYTHQRLTIDPDQITLPADGAGHPAFRIRRPWPNGTVTQETNQAPNLRLLEAKNAVIEAILQAPVNPGHAQLHLLWRHRGYSIPVTFLFDPSDTYADGTPDFLRLHTTQDREAFRAWFTTIAEHQADQPTQLSPEINDCAALLRYAYREALHLHDETWLSSHTLQSAAPSIRQYAYPQTPLGANLFRIRPGPFLPADLNNGTFAQFADAQTLMQHSTYLVGRDLRLARPGDLIFYRQLDQDSPYDVPGTPRYHSPFHSMIFCGEKGVVYHTGPMKRSKGEMRRLLLSDLLHHPDARWRPLKENENFLGVYRWNILREGD
jgi:uncharacterized protein